MANSYKVYVVELSRRVFTENAKFRKANIQYSGMRDCLYVGMTSKSAKERFAQHLRGHRSKKGYNISSRIVQKYGLYLRPSLYEHLSPMTKVKALEMEKKLSLELRSKGYAVWFN